MKTEKYRRIVAFLKSMARGVLTIFVVATLLFSSVGNVISQYVPDVVGRFIPTTHTAFAATLPTLIPGGGTTPNAGDADTGSSGSVLNAANTACNAADCYLDVDDTISGADTTTYINNTDTNGTYVQGFELTDMPADFSSMTTVVLDIRHQRTGTRSDDDIILYAQIFQDGGATAMTNQIEVCRWTATDNCGSSWTTQSALPFTITGTNNKTNWDRVELHFTWAGTKNKGPDTMEIQITAAEIEGTYVAAAIPPTVSTNAASGVTATNATLNGNVSDQGSAEVTARGFAWGTDSTLATAFGTSTNGTGTGAFINNVSGLIAGTRYYFRAYATNSAGTGYGSITFFDAGTDTTATRKLRLFEGFTLKFINGRMILYQQ